MVASFTNLVQPILKSLSADDYPVLNSRLFFEIWFNFILDQSLTRMRDWFYRLNHTGIKVDISTFSKACKSREDHKFYRIYNQLLNQLKKKNKVEALTLLPIDSTVITLTSKLFWKQNYRQVKLLNGINISQGNPTECPINFGQEPDAKFLDYIPTLIGSNQLGVMDRGFARMKRLVKSIESVGKLKCCGSS